MPTKIRLQRKGRKARPFYHVVVADSRAPRDGKYIEKLGSYNPNTNPATIDINFDKALTWLQNGAQPTDTCRALLSYEGVLMKNHLLNGVKKGAFDEKTAEAKFEAWKNQKDGKIDAKKNKLATDKDAANKQRLEAEAKVNEERAQALAKKKAEALEAATAEEATEEAQAEETETTETEA